MHENKLDFSTQSVAGYIEQQLIYKWHLNDTLYHGPCPYQYFAQHY